MNHYIQNNEFYILPEPLGVGYDVSETNSLEDLNTGKIILLNDAQIAFMETNPNATTLEVFNMELTPKPVLTLEQKKNIKISEIVSYDQSHAVNSFAINGMMMWLDSETRSKLYRRFDAETKLGNTTTQLWYEGVVYPLTLELATSLLTQLEYYACRCYDITELHKQNVMKCETIEEVNSYDHTQGYPDKVVINL